MGIVIIYNFYKLLRLIRKLISTLSIIAGEYNPGSPRLC